jgi:hypothetical protein
MTGSPTIHNASITTATVTINTLKVSGKQVSVALFLQLQEAQLVAEDGTMVGVPWGMVNYHADKQNCPSGEHRHVVWQHGDELRRATVTKPSWGRYQSSISDRFIFAAGTLDPWQGFSQHQWQPPEWAQYSTVNEWEFTVDAMDCLGKVPDECGKFVNADDPIVAQHRALDSTAILETLQEEIAVEKERRARYEKRWTEIVALPQLFIAV